MSYYAMQSCTSGRNAFFTGMYPLRTGDVEAISRIEAVSTILEVQSD